MKKVAISSKTTKSSEKSGEHLWERATCTCTPNPLPCRPPADQVHCTQLWSLHTRIVVQSCSYAPTSERMLNYAPNFQPPNYANNYAGIIRRCLGGGQQVGEACTRCTESSVLSTRTSPAESLDGAPLQVVSAIKHLGVLFDSSQGYHFRIISNLCSRSSDNG